MKVEQVYGIVNDLTKQYIGEDAVVEADLHNITDIGKSVIDLSNLDRYVNSLIDRIGKVVFVDRVYTSKTPSLIMESWEYGAILEKIQYEGLPEAEENSTWNLVDKQVYEQDMFTQPTVSAKFFSKKVTYDIPMSFARRQIQSAFTNRVQINAFFSMIENAIDKSMTVKIDELAMGALNNMIGNTLLSNKGMASINLLKGYNDAFGKTLLAKDSIYDADFIRYASYVIGLTSQRIQRLSTLFNTGEKERFTSSNRMSLILLSEFSKAADAYLQSDVYHNEFTKLPQADTVPYWQGSGTNYSFESTSKINIVCNDGTQNGTNIEATGILGVMFDREAVAVSNLDRRVRTHNNERAEFINNWYKFDCGYFNDLNENFVVFYVKDSE